jgi:hypothetical protein
MMEYLVAILEGCEVQMTAKLDCIASRCDANQAKADTDHEELMSVTETTQERVISLDRRQARTQEGLSRNTGRGEEKNKRKIKIGLEVIKERQPYGAADH